MMSRLTYHRPWGKPRAHAECRGMKRTMNQKQNNPDETRTRNHSINCRQYCRSEVEHSTIEPPDHGRIPSIRKIYSFDTVAARRCEQEVLAGRPARLMPVSCTGTPVFRPFNSKWQLRCSGALLSAKSLCGGSPINLQEP
jgi:hypothetical protein